MGEFVSFPRKFTEENHFSNDLDGLAGIATVVGIAAVPERHLPERHIMVSGQKLALASYARRLLKARRTIAKVMPKKLFRDSAWDVMLELYIGAIEGEDVFVKQAIIASGECPATAMRIISRLDKSGFLARNGDASDQRRVLVTLTPKGCEAMELVLEQLGGDLIH